MVESFWNTQPVENGISSKIILKPKKILTERYKLKEGLSWEINNDVKKIVKFLKENYVEDDESNFRMYYSEEFFNYLFSDPKHRKEYSLSIIDSNGMAGYIFAKEHDLVIKGIEQNIVSINFLCLRADLRRNKLAPLLIKEITRVVNNFNIFQAIFTGHKNYGFSILKTAYYHFILDAKKLFNLKFIDIMLDCVSDKYKISSETVLASNDNLKTIYKNYCKNIEKYKLYEKFTEKEFLYVFNNKNKVVYMLYNKIRNEFVSFFIIESFSIEKNQYFSIAYLYYWNGSYRIIEDAICYARSLGILLFNVLDLNDNKNIIKEFDMLPGTGELWYHLYNWRENSISNEKVNFILF